MSNRYLPTIPLVNGIGWIMMERYKYVDNQVFRDLAELTRQKWFLGLTEDIELIEIYQSSRIMLLNRRVYRLTRDNITASVIEPCIYTFGQWEVAVFYGKEMSDPIRFTSLEDVHDYLTRLAVIPGILRSMG